MKGIQLILCGCLLFATAEANNSGVQDLSVCAYSASSPNTRLSARSQSSPKTAEEGARLVLPVATHDFGDVPRKGGDLKREFVFRNEGSVPLVIVRVLTSCSCLKAAYPKRPVPPGGEGVIAITYEPNKREPGVFNKVIRIYSNSVKGCEVICVQGNSIDEARPRKGKPDNMNVKFKE